MFSDLKSLPTEPVFTKADILTYISQEEIYKVVFGELPKIGKKYCSPFRDDDEPNCYFEYYNKMLRFVDFGNSSVWNGIKLKNIDCFNAISIYFNIKSFKDTLRFIHKNLIKEKNISFERNIERDVSYQKVMKNVKKELVILPTEWNEENLSYWKDYGINEKQLKEDLVIPLNTCYIVSDKYKKIDFPYDVYSFNEFPKNLKIYNPFSKKFRFISTCTNNDIGGYLTVNFQQDYLVVTKSYKDCRVLRNFGINSIWLQSENSFPDTSKSNELLKNFKKVVIFFDNDKTGKECSLNFIETVRTICPNVSNFSIPDTFIKYNVKDISDFYKKFSINDTQFAINKLKDEFKYL